MTPRPAASWNTPAAGPNCCKGVIDDVVYAGDATRYSVGLGAAGTLTVKVQNRAASRRLSSGESLEVAWDPEDTRIFARAGDDG